MPNVPFREALRYWIRLGFINFGGPVGQIAIMHRELVDERQWIDDKLFLRALNFCMLLPGPEAQQLAIYIGWRMHGYAGGVVAGTFFVLPSIFLLLFLSWLAVVHSDIPAIAGIFHGIAPVVVAIVTEAVGRIGKRALKRGIFYAIAGASFVAGYLLAAPFPLVVLLAALTGLYLERAHPGYFCVLEPGTTECKPEETGGAASLPSVFHVARMALLFIVCWLAVILPLWLWHGSDDILVREAMFFSKAAFVTFGGAYAVLSYISDLAVNLYGWLTPKEMLLGLGLAESTPGPLIMVTQFIGFIAAYKLPATGSPLVYGILGALVTTVMTFMPCFFFVFAGSPYIEYLSGNQRLQAALTAVTAAIVGVVLKLAVFFGVHTFFPSDGHADLFAVILAAGSFAAIARFHVPIHHMVAVGAAVGMAWQLIFKG